MKTTRWMDIVEAGIRILRIVRDLLAQFHDEDGGGSPEPTAG